nr:uncharacterized protein LOC125982384 [Syngnathus scovelli]
MRAKKRALAENFSDLKLHQTQICCPRCDSSTRASSLHLQQKTQIDCKKVSKWPACSPESPDFTRRQQTAVGEKSRASPAFILHRWSQRTWYLSAAWIEVKAPGGAGPGSQETRSHDLPVLAVQLPVRVLRPSTCWAKKFSKTMPKVSVQERLCNISRAWPDVSHLINGFSRRFLQKWLFLVQKVKSLPQFVSTFICQWSRSTCGSSQTIAGVPSCCLESPLLVREGADSSSHWLTTSPFVPLADHFTTRPTGRPLHHSSRWLTTSPLVPLADHLTTRPTG